MSRPRVFTIGHSTRQFDELIDMLRRNDVTTLVDVRSYPSSRKFPQWNQESILAAMPEGIDYLWMKKLGGRRHTPTGVHSPNTAWRVKAFRDYADYMATNEFHDGLDELLILASQACPAIMCSEAVPWRCHRRLITDALLIAGAEVYDIMSETVTKPAKLNDAAQVCDGRIVYPASQESLWHAST